MIFLVSSQSYYLDREGVVQFYLSRVFYTFIYAIPVTLKTQCMCLWCLSRNNCCRCIVEKKVCEQVSKNIFNKNDNRRVAQSSCQYNKIGMGLVMSHTYNLSHAYLSHTPHTVKHPTSVAL